MCDFGYSKHEANSHALSVIGTPNYMAPEVIKGSNVYDPFKADIWSVGVVLYVMLMGKYPYDKDRRGEVMIVPIIKGEWHPFDPNIPLSFEARSLVAAMLETEPKDRITMEGILADPWFQEGLPPGALDMNEVWLELAPKADEPPLCLLPDFLNHLVKVACERGSKGDGSENVRCQLPCRKIMEDNYQDGQMATDGLSINELTEALMQIEIDFVHSMSNSSGERSRDITPAVTYNEPKIRKPEDNVDDRASGSGAMPPRR